MYRALWLRFGLLVLAACHSSTPPAPDPPWRLINDVNLGKKGRYQGNTIRVINTAAVTRTLTLPGCDDNGVRIVVKNHHGKTLYDGAVPEPLSFPVVGGRYLDVSIGTGPCYAIALE